MIREATLDDLLALVNIGQLMHQESPFFSPIPFDEQKLIDSLIGTLRIGIVIVHEHKGIIDGAIMGMVIDYLFSRKKRCMESAFYVVPKRRGTGIASQLLKSFIDKGIEQGADEIFVGASTGINHDVAIRLYEGHGFKKYGESFVLRGNYV